MAVREPYVTSTGEVVPSVTTIIGRFKDSGPLVWWANKQGLQGLTLEKAREPAMTAGTMAHDLVEAKINSQPAGIGWRSRQSKRRGRHTRSLSAVGP